MVVVWNIVGGVVGTRCTGRPLGVTVLLVGSGVTLIVVVCFVTSLPSPLTVGVVGAGDVGAAAVEVVTELMDVVGKPIREGTVVDGLWTGLCVTDWLAGLGDVTLAATPF